MNSGGDAAEQMFRMTLEGTEFAVKIAGKGAKEIAILLYTILSQQKKTNGHVSLANMLKTSDKTYMYSIDKIHMRKFAERAKAYGVKYHVCLQDKNKVVHLMTDEKSVSKVDRIIQELGIANVDINKIAKEIQREKAQKNQKPQNTKAKAPGPAISENAERTTPNVPTVTPQEENEKGISENADEKDMLDSILSASAKSEKTAEPKPEQEASVPAMQPEEMNKGVQTKSAEEKLMDALMLKPTQAEKQSLENNAANTVPFGQTAEKSHPSEPFSKMQSKNGKGFMSNREDRKSVV